MAKYAKIAVPAARSSAPVLAIRRRIILVVLILAALIGVFTSCSVLTSGSTPPVTQVPVATNAVALATQVARSYLEAVPTTVPVADDVDPGFGMVPNAAPFKYSGLTLSGVEQLSFGTGGIPATLVRFMVLLTETDEEGQSVNTPYQLTVPMVTIPGEYPQLGAVPSLSPMSLSSASVAPALDPKNFGGNAGEANEEVEKVAKDWGKAYAAGGVNDSNLKRVTGDPNRDHYYNGLGGWTAKSVAVDGVMPAPKEGDPGFVVRVTLVLQPPAGTGSDVKASYDVWVAQTSANQANPPVVAWGPPGTGSQLTQYQNAQVKKS